MNNAVVLLSGGMDSATALAIAKAEGFNCYTLSFDYGQKHQSELAKAKLQAQLQGAKRHVTLNLDLHDITASALTCDDIAVPDYSGDGKIPPTYVPARNTVFLSLALGWAEVVAASRIYVGVSAIDYSGYPDCRPEYIKAFQAMADLATKAGVEGHGVQLHTPLIHLSKAATIERGLALGVDYAQTVTCYRANAAGEACGTCDSCVLRLQGYAELGLTDPAAYQKTVAPVLA